ncbi:MAG: hypothetical protein V3U96_01795 [Paracoccaceae bacterium]
MTHTKSDNSMIMGLNALGVVAAYVLLGFSLYLSVDVPLSTKGFWGMGIVLLTLSLINVVKYRFDNQATEDRIRQLEDAKNEKLLEEFVTESKDT